MSHEQPAREHMTAAEAEVGLRAHAEAFPSGTAAAVP